jgi:hypothetical protein
MSDLSSNLATLSNALPTLMDNILTSQRNDTSTEDILKKGGEQLDLETVFGTTYDVPDCSNPLDWPNSPDESHMCTTEIIAAEMCDKKNHGWDQCHLKKKGTDGTINAIGVSSAPRKYAVCCQASEVISGSIDYLKQQNTQNLVEYISGYEGPDGDCDQDCLFGLINNLSDPSTFEAGCPATKCKLGKESITATGGVMNKFKFHMVPCISTHGLLDGALHTDGAGPDESSFGRGVDTVCNTISDSFSDPTEADSLLGGVGDAFLDVASYGIEITPVGVACDANEAINWGERDDDDPLSLENASEKYATEVKEANGKQQLRRCINSLKDQIKEKNTTNYDKDDKRSCNPTLIAQANNSVLYNQMQTLNMGRDTSSGEKDTSVHPIGVKRTPWTEREIQEAEKNQYSEHVENIITRQLGYMDDNIPGCGVDPKNMSEEQLDTCFGPFKPMNDLQWPILFNKIMADMLGPILTIIAISGLIFGLFYFLCLFNESFRAELMEEGSI